MTGRVDRLHGELVTLLAAYRDADAGQCAVREAMLAYLAARPALWTQRGGRRSRRAASPT